MRRRSRFKRLVLALILIKVLLIGTLFALAYFTDFCPRATATNDSGTSAVAGVFSDTETGFTSISAMAQGGGNIYIVSLLSPVVKAYNKSTGEISEVFSVSQDGGPLFFTDVIVSETHIYGALAFRGQLVIYDRASGDVEIMNAGLRSMMGASEFNHFTTDGDYIYINGFSGLSIFCKQTRTFTVLERSGAHAAFFGNMFSDGDSLYIGGGFGNQLLVFNKATQTFSVKQMPNAGTVMFDSMINGVSDEAHLYIVRGTSSLYVYDRATGTAAAKTPEGAVTFDIQVITQDEGFVYVGGNSGRFAILSKETGIIQAVDLGVSFNIVGIAVAGNHIYLAGGGGQFMRIPHPELREFSVTFVSRDDREIMSTLFAQNTVVQISSQFLLQAPRVLGFAFSHWELVSGSDVGQPLTQDTIFRAVYTETTVFTVTFLTEDGTVHQIVELNEGERISNFFIPIPPKEGHSGRGWEHVSGDEFFGSITQDSVFRATYWLDFHRVSFYDNTGRISIETRPHGWVIEAPADPQTFIEDGWIHTFSHWEPVGNNIGEPLTRDTTFTAVFDRELMRHTVQFRCEFHRDTIGFVTLFHGEIIEGIEPPSPTGARGGAFIGWQLIDGDEMGSPITRDTRFRAVYEGGVENLTTIVLMNNGTVFAEVHLERGTILTEAHLPQMPSSAGSFTQWPWYLQSQIGQPLTQLFQVIHLQTLERNHEVILLDINGNFFTAFMLLHGSTITINVSAPVVEGKAFLRWERVTGNNLGEPITNASTFRAVYETSMHTIKFILHGEVVFEGTLAHGTIISIDITPENFRDEDYIYTFARWFCNSDGPGLNVGDPITRNVVFTAVFDKRPIPYFTLRFYNTGSFVRELSFREGTTITQQMLPILDNPVHPQNSNWVFDAWATQDGRPAVGLVITENLVFQATFKDGYKTVEIAFIRNTQNTQIFDFIWDLMANGHHFTIVGNGFNFNTNAVVRSDAQEIVFRAVGFVIFDLTTDWQDFELNATIDGQTWDIVQIRLPHDQQPNPPKDNETELKTEQFLVEPWMIGVGIAVLIFILLILISGLGRRR